MKWIIVLTCFITGVSSAQEAKFVLNKEKDFYEEYFVSSADGKTREGTYAKYRYGAGVQLLETGIYTSGKKNGEWQVYYDLPRGITAGINSLKEKGHYVNDKKNGIWMTFYLDTARNNISLDHFGDKRNVDSLYVNVQQNGLKTRSIGQYLNDKRIGEWFFFDYSGELCQKYNYSKSKLLLERSLDDTLEYNNNRKAVYIGGQPSLYHFLSIEFGIPEIIAALRKDSLTVSVQFDIHTNGTMSDLRIQESNAPKAVEKEVLRCIALLNNNWLPALKDGHPVTSTHKLAVDIFQKFASRNSRSIRLRFRL